MTKTRMDKPDSHAPVTEQASHWWMVLNSDEADESDHRAFSEWVVRSPERLEAFLQTALITKVLKSPGLRWPDISAAELAREVRDAADVEPIPLMRGSQRRTPAPTSRAHRGPLKWAALAASVLVFLAVGWVIRSSAGEYQTALGEQRSVVLSDGSIVLLNTASRMRVTMRKDHRLIELLAGEALFQVAKDPARPFEVAAGATQVRAVGTQFNVDRRTQSTVVTVIEGRVTVSSDSSPASARSRPEPLAAGEQMSVTPTSLRKSPRVDIAAATAWTQRRLVFERRSLGEVAEEFNRYNPRAIHIDSPTLRQQEVTGAFQANEPDSLLDFIAQIPGIKIERAEDGIHVVDATP